MAIDKPNILLIVADDLGVDVLLTQDFVKTVGIRRPGGLPSERYRLPNLERLMRNGVHFTRTWAHPVCAPTRGTLFSGLNPWRTGVGDAAGDPHLPLTLPSDGRTDLKTLANFVSSAGYECGIFGKWDLGGETTTYVPTARGWHRHEGILGGGLRPIGQTVSEAELRQKYYTWEKVIGDAYLGFVRENIQPVDRTYKYATEDEVYSARDWIKQVAGRPWWATLALLAPHDPYHIPPEGTYTIKFRDPTNPTDQEMFVAMVEAMDYYLGKLFDDPSPEIRNELKNTVIIFVGDNGTQDQLDYRLGDDKSTVYIGGVHVPLLIADGGRMFGGAPCYLDPARVSAEDASLVHIVDLFQTIIDITGGPQPSYPLDSFTLMPHLKNDPKFTNRPKRTYNFAQFFTSPDADPNRYQRLGLRATISDGNYKLNYQNGTWEFAVLSFDQMTDKTSETKTNDFNHPKAQELWQALVTSGGPYYAEVGDKGQKFPALPGQTVVGPQLIGIGMDQQLYYRETLTSNWILIPNSGAFISVTVMADGSILGVGVDKRLYRRNNLTGAWYNVPSVSNSPLVHLATRFDGGFVAVGEDASMYDRNSLTAPGWEISPNNYNVMQSITCLPDESILALSKYQLLYHRETLFTRWSIIQNNLSLRHIAALPDGKVIGVGTDYQLYYRPNLYGNWINIPNSGSIQNVTYGGKAKR